MTAGFHFTFQYFLNSKWGGGGGGGGEDCISAERINATLLWFTHKSHRTGRKHVVTGYLKLRGHVIEVA